MKKPKLIYVYWQSEVPQCSVKKHELRLYKPNCYDGPGQLGDNLFGIEAQSNTDTQPIGLLKAYGWYIERLPLDKPSVLPLVAKVVNVVSQSNQPIKPLLKLLHKLGAVRYSLGKVDDPRSYNKVEHMPRKFSRAKSVAYWRAVTAGLEVN